MKQPIDPTRKRNIIICCGIIAVCLSLVGFLLLIDSVDKDKPVKPLPPKPTVHITPQQPKPKAHDDTIITFVLKQEGGYNPQDPSYEGVYQPTWEWYREIKNDKSYPLQVQNLVGRHDLILGFYKWYIYELRSGVAVVPDWFQLMLADFWVTSMSASIRPLQTWAGVKSDGVWGKHTEIAVLQKFDTIQDEIEFARWYTNERKTHYRDHGHSESSSLFSRCDIVLSETIKMIHNSKPPVYHRTIDAKNIRIHASSETMSFEERLDRLEKLILELADK